MTTARDVKNRALAEDGEKPKRDDWPDVPLDEPGPVPIEDPPADGPSEPPPPMVVTPTDEPLGG